MDASTGTGCKNDVKNLEIPENTRFAAMMDELVDSQELYEISTDQYYGWGYFEKDSISIAGLLKYRNRYQKARLVIRTFLETAGNEYYAIGNEMTLFDMGIIR